MSGGKSYRIDTLMHPKHMCLVEEDESTCGSIVIPERSIVRRPDTLPKLETISSKNQSVGVSQQQPLSKETNRVTATRGVTLKPLQRRTHQPRWDSLVIPPTWNYKGVRVKGARFDNTEPEDDDVVRHIVRLRSKRGWPTILPGHQHQKRTKTYSDHPQGGSHGTQDTGEYVYCIRRNEGDVQYNPYELKVVSVQTAKQHSRYWTISATCVQEVSVLQQYSEVVPVMDWLADRDLFHKIYLLPFFSKFRLLKSFSKWKNLIKRSKFSENRTTLSETLFFVDVIAAQCLLGIRALLESSFNFNNSTVSDDSIVLIKWDGSKTHSLSDFCEAQEQLRESASVQLQGLHDQVVSMARSAFFKMAEIRGVLKLFHPRDPKDPKSCPPPYGEMLKWKMLMKRFGRFLAMVDYMFETVLSDLLRATVSTLHSSLWASYHHAQAGVKLEDADGTTQADAESHEEDLDGNQDEEDEEDDGPVHSEDEAVKAAFVVHVMLTISQRDSKGNWITITPLSDQKKPENQKEMEGALHRSSDREKTAEMTISPSMEDFMEKIQQVLDGFCNVIVKQIPLFKDPSLLDLHRPSMFTAELFDVSEEEGSAAVRSWPDLQLLLGQDAVYQMQVSEVLSMVKRGFDEAERRCVSMQKFCKMVSTAMFLHVDSFLEEETWTAQDLKAILMAHVDSVQQMLKMRMEKRVNMMLISCRQYQRDCLPYPQTLLHNMHMLLPTFVQRKNLDLMEVIQSALRNLESSSETLDEFVDHLNFLSEISVKLPGLERQYHFLVQLYSIVKQFNIIIPAENLALFRHLIYSFASLKSTILICETKRDDKIFTFITDLSKQLSKLRHDLILIRMKIFNPLLVCASTSMEMATELLQTLAEDLDTYSCKAYSYFRFRELLGRSFSRKNKGSIANKEEVTDAVVEQELNEVSNALTLRRMLWDMQREWHTEYTQWRATPFELLNVDDLQNDVNRFTQTIYILTKGLPENDIVPQLKQKLGDFKQCLPIIIALRNPHLRRRHIEEIQKNVGRFFLPDDGSTLGDLLDLKILQHSRLVSEISSTATHEATLETILSKVIELWSYTDFRLITHTSESCTVKIIASADDVMMQLEESQTTIMSLKSSRYVEPIKGSIEEWDRKLKHFSSTLSEWVTCQKRWLYLEAIFSAVGIQRQLPTEAKLFEEVNEAWKQLMLKTEQDPNALRNGTFPGVLEDLQNNNSQLEKIQKCLEDYLESKRNIFPRFYFLSNEELISVLTQSRNPSVIQPFLVKCFSNIYRLEMQEQTLLHPLLVQLHSLEGETITMPTIVQIRGPVEQWMGNVETAMYNAVKRHMRLAVADWNPDDFTNWAIAHPGQVVLTVTQIMFSSDCERCLSGGSGQREGLRAVQQQMIGSVEALTALAFKQLASHKQATVETLFTILVHCRDILSHLIQHNVISADNFEWRRQLLYNWHDSTSLCYVVQAKSSFAYGYEYQGCSPRLVITPLTDRCWLTLTGALSLHLGGALVGPTATGKTESVKDLAKALGKFCLVMNCCASLDYKMMGKLYSGMVQSGAWCCFDEFNSISVKVLSVIAAQLQSIRAAKNSHSTRFTFEGRDIRLNASCGYFITMNPSSRGRVELPDNLKILVRPVAMMVPDFHLIAEIILFSTGFKSAKTLSRKIVHLYQVASKQLSQQDHYDFSMRSIKPVLLLAGHKRRAVMLVSLSSEEEYCILICALQEFNLPKLIPEDVPLFQGIMHDLFPEVVAPKAVHPQLENAITKAIDALGLQRCPIQAEKVTQLYSQILAHTGVMLVGPTGGGKTTIRLILQHALEIMPAFMHRSSFLWGNELYMDCFTINPKCVELGELFGQMNPNTLEWSDGLLASAIRNYAKELSQGEKKPTPATAEVPANNPGPGAVQRPPTVNNYQGAPPGAPVIEKWRWVIMDGPVDSLWVESLNTALDESSTLCLINGERINLPDGLSFLFEVDSLSHATPATISRCAMVYVDPVGKAWKLYVDRWLSQLSSFMKEHGVAYLKKLMYGTVNQGVFFVHSHRKLLSFRVPELSLVMTLCSILNSIFNLLHKNGGLGQNEDKTCHNVYTSGRSGLQDCGRRRRRTTACNEEVKWFLQKYPDKLTSLLGKLYVFAFTWAFGGVLNHMNEYDDAHGNYRDKSDPLVKASHEFQTLLRELFEGGQHYGIPLPSGNLFSYFVDMQTDSFVLWEELVPSTEILIRRGLTPGRRDVASAYSAVYSGRDTLTPNSQHVSNLDSIRYSFLISLLLVHDQPVLLTGDSGVGKSMLIESMLKKLQRDQGDIGNPSTILGQVFLHHQAKTVSLLEDVSLLTDGLTDNDYPYGDSTDMVSAASTFGKLHSMEQEEGMGSSESGILTRPFQCTAHTGPQHIKAHVLHGLTKRGQNLLGASKNRKVLIFLDDINMPVPDESGVQPSMELLRQFIEADGVHDTKTLSWKGIQDVTFFAACAPPGGGRQQLSKRLLRHFSLLALPHPSYSTMSHIFQVQLGKFLVSGDFCMEVQQCRETLVSAAIAIYLEMCHSVLPSPARYHYTYNLRDLYKVIHGLMQCHSSEVRTDEALAYLLANEASRVFHDRLMSDEDRQIFCQIVANELQIHFKVFWGAESMMKEPVMFADFLDPTVPIASRVYKHIRDKNKILPVLEDCHNKHCKTKSGFPMVFFREAVEHVTRAARIFRQQGSHMMLIGLDGTGKESCVTLACHLAACRLYRLSVSRNCSYSDFRDDIRRVFYLTGVEQLDTVLLITDPEILKESVMKDLDCLLKCGDLPGLFNSEDIDNITADLRTRGRVWEKREEAYTQFTKQVKQRLHVVLTMSPAGSRLRQFCWSHPALLGCCNIDWYSPWSKESLLQVARSMYINAEDYYLGEGLHELVAQACVDMHYSISQMAERYGQEARRPYYVVPSIFSEFMGTFFKMLRSREGDLHSIRNRYTKGLAILLESTSYITVMKEELVALSEKIEEKTEEIETLMSKLQRDADIVEQVRAIVQMEENIMIQETQIVQDYAQEAQVDLKTALPLLEKAREALDGLDKNDISEIRVYTNPPDLVLTVMYAVCILLQQKPTWAVAKVLLGDPGFLKKLVGLDKDTLPDKVFLSLRRYSKDPDFTPEKVGRVSNACRSICQWVLALDHYHDVLKIIEPKQKKVRVAEEALAKAKWNMKEKEKNLAKIEEHQASLQERYNASVAEKKELAMRQEQTVKRLQRAGQLISALSDEKDRWKTSVAELDSQLKHIVGDTLISSAFITYCGPLSTHYRQAILKTWLESCKKAEIVVSEDYAFISTMTKKNEIRQWHTNGLPSDRTSTENALIIQNGPHWPLIIDPQGQAQRWLSRKEGLRLYTVQASNPSYMKTVERALRTGDAVLIQDITESVDPCLRPVLEKKISAHGSHCIIKIGDNEVEYNPNFRLYMTTSLPNPHFLPSLCIIVKVVNFNMEYEGLREQLLSSALTLQQPQLETQHGQLLLTINSLLIELHQLEERSLQLLQDTMGNILDDQVLIDNLRKTKETFNKVLHRAQSTKEKEQEMAKVRKKYLPIAGRAADLYIILAELAQINYMYQFSLEWFMGKYTQALMLGGSVNERHYCTVSMVIRTDFNTEDFHQHLLSLMDVVTEIIYKDVSLALFSEHRLCFSFLLCCRVLQKELIYLPPGCTESLTPEEWRTFLHTPVLADMLASRRHRMQERPAHVQWMSVATWNQCQYLSSELHAFSGLCHSMQFCRAQWNIFQQAEGLYGFLATPYAAEGTAPAAQATAVRSKSAETLRAIQVPVTRRPEAGRYTAVFAWQNLTGFQRIILIKVLRPDSLTSAVRRFVTENIGAKFVEESKMSLLDIYRHSNSTTPIIFLLSPGTDPASLLLRLAQDLYGSSLIVDLVSLGQGQGERAHELISKAQVQKGRWVFLQNCHLATSFMSRLQTLVNTLKWKGSDLDPHFRLWLSSKPNPAFPAAILQRGLKVAVDPPQDLKQKLLHMVSVSGEVTEKTYTKPECGPAWKTLVFSLCFFHSVIQERKKYKSMGWNIPYIFTSADLEVSLLNQEMMLKGCAGGEVPWVALRYLTGEVVYGGHVMDPWDQRCLSAILENCYNPDVLENGPIFFQGQGYPRFPRDCSWTECCEYVRSLPDEDMAEALGIGGSAQTLVQQDQAQQLMHTIIGLQPRLSSMRQQKNRDKESQDEVALRLALYILEKLPEHVETDHALARTIHLQDVISKVRTMAKESGGQRPLALLVVLNEEVRRFERLLGVVRTSLLNFCCAVRGEALMTESTEEIHNALLTMTLPDSWKVISYESCKALGSWVLDLEARIKFFQAWSDHVKMKHLMSTEEASRGSPFWKRCMKMMSCPQASERDRPRSYWLSGFFFPQGFLTAVLQEYARQRNLSVDSLCFSHHVQRFQEDTPDWSTAPQKSTLLFEGAEPPEQGVLVYGLYLSGASWDPDSQTLQEPLPKLKNYPMPEIHFLPCQCPDDTIAPDHPLVTVKQKQQQQHPPETQGGEQPELSLYECPVYCTSTRTGELFSTGLSSNFITAMSLPTSQHPSHWIFRGTAMLCQRDE